MQVNTIGLDIAKNVFQVHGVDGEGQTVLCRKLRRDRLMKLFESIEPCLIGMLQGDHASFDCGLRPCSG